MNKRVYANDLPNDKNEQPLTEEEILKERLHKAWLLTCEAYGIDPENPPKMEKRMFFAGSFEDHQKYVDEQERIFKINKQNGH
ncbi:MAG: hypothetical protein JNM14_15025 [Ferruginibacter sp.]|nr:hypothetical protein [Ferruginibacter sp.]